MTRPTRPLAGVTPDDTDTQRRMARALAAHPRVGEVQDAVHDKVVAALLHAGFVQTSPAKVRVDVLGSGAHRELVSDWVEPVNAAALQLRCTFYARFAGPKAGHTRLSVTMVQKPEPGASRLDEGVAAHLLVATTPPPPSQHFEAHPELSLLSQWESQGLTPEGSWGDHGPLEFVTLANRHFAR